MITSTWANLHNESLCQMALKHQVLREREKLSISSEHCWINISDDHFVVFGKRVSLVRVQGVAAGVLIEGEFYPVLTDHRGGIISAFDHRSGEPLFLRHFDNWGNKQVKSYSQKGEEVDKLIVWDFSQLIHNPLLKGNNILNGIFRMLFANCRRMGNNRPTIYEESRIPHSPKRQLEPHPVRLRRPHQLHRPEWVIRASRCGCWCHRCIGKKLKFQLVLK